MEKRGGSRWRENKVGISVFYLRRGLMSPVKVDSNRCHGRTISHPALSCSSWLGFDFHHRFQYFSRNCYLAFTCAPPHK